MRTVNRVLRFEKAAKVHRIRCIDMGRRGNLQHRYENMNKE